MILWTGSVSLSDVPGYQLLSTILSKMEGAEVGLKQLQWSTVIAVQINCMFVF